MIWAPGGIKNSHILDISRDCLLSPKQKWKPVLMSSKEPLNHNSRR